MVVRLRSDGNNDQIVAELTSGGSTTLNFTDSDQVTVVQFPEDLKEVSNLITREWELIVGGVAGAATVIAPPTGTDQFLRFSSATVWWATNNASNMAFTPVGNIAGTTVALALAELDTEKAALSGAAFSGLLSAAASGGQIKVVVDGTANNDWGIYNSSNNLIISNWVAGATNSVKLTNTTPCSSSTTGSLVLSGGFATSYSPTNTSGTRYGGINTITANPTGASTAWIFGTASIAETSSGNSQNQTLVCGGVNSGYHLGSGTLVSLYGGWSEALNRSSGAITSLIGRYVNWGNTGTGSVTDAYAHYVETLNASGPIVNAYGIYINNVSGASANNYAIKTKLGLVDFGDHVNVATGKVYKVAGTQVVGARGAAVADAASANATDLASAITLVNELKAQLNALLARVRAHGLIAT